MKFTLEQAKARNAEILSKVQAVESKAQTKKRDIWLQQQKLQWIDSWRRLKSSPTLALDEQDDVWGPVNGAREFFRAFLAHAQDTTKRNALKEVLDGVRTVLHLTLVDLQHEQQQLEADLMETRQLGEELELMEHASLSDDEDDLMDEMTASHSNHAYAADLRNVLEGYVETRAHLLRECEESKAQFQQATRSLPLRDTLSTPEAIVSALGPIAGVTSLQWIWRGNGVKKETLLECLRCFDRRTYTTEALTLHCNTWRQKRYDLYVLTREKYRHGLLLEEVQSEKRLEEEKKLQKECKIKKRLVGLKEERMKMNEQTVVESRRVREEEFDRYFSEKEKSEMLKKGHVESIKEQALAFQDEKRALKELEEEEARAKREFEEKERRICGEYNATRVSARRTLARMKQEEREELQYLREEQERDAAERLERALQRMKPKVECDRERLLLPLEKDASAAPCNVSQLRGPLAGFTVDQLMKDARYKLSYALHSAGLHESEAARMTLIHTQASTAPRRDTIPSYAREP